MNDKVRPDRGHTKGRGKGWKKGQSPKKDMREVLGITRHEAYSWIQLSHIPEDIFDEFIEKIRVREEAGTIANALRYARAKGLNPDGIVTERPRTFEVTYEELTSLPWACQMGRDAAQLLKDIDNLEHLKGNEDGRQLAIAIAFLEGWIERFGERLQALGDGRGSDNAEETQKKR